MKNTQNFKHRFFKVILHGLTLSFVGCGVEAGNPDSKGDKLLRIFIAPASYPDTSAVSATIQQVKIINSTAGETKDSKPISDKIEIIPSSSLGTQVSSLGLTIERTDESSFEKVELILAEKSPYLQLSLRSLPEPVFAAVIDEDGQIKNSLIFNTQFEPSSSSDILIDVELRKSLRVISESQREQLQLPPQVRFVIQQKHSFINSSDVGAISFSSFAPESLVCVFTGDNLPKAEPKACTGPSFKSQIVSAEGVATIGSLVPGHYRSVNITSDNKVIELAPTFVTAGKKSLVEPK